MKKLFGVVCTVLSAAACIGALAACGDDADGAKQTVTENTDPKTLISDQLTEAEFNAAMSGASFDNCVFYNKMGVNGWLRMTYADTKRKMETKFGEDPESVAYYGKEGEQYFLYRRDGEDFKRIETDRNGWDEIAFGSESIQYWVSNVAYKDLEWSDADKGYLADFAAVTGASESVSYAEQQTSIVLKFVDKRFAAYYVKGMDSAEYNGLLYNYGKASVTLPVVSGLPEGGGEVQENTDAEAFVSEKITAEELANAKEEANFSNVVFYTDLSILGYTRVTYDGNKRKYEGGTGVSYLEKEGNQYYKYEKTGSGYQKTETTAKEWDDLTPIKDDPTLPLGYMLQFFKDVEYSDLTWSEQENGYLYSVGDLEEPIVLKFAEKKLALYYVQGTADQMKGVLYKYGSASVTLPDLNKQYVDENTDPSTLVSEQVTGEEWAAAIAEDAFSNASFVVNVSSDQMETTRIMTVITEGGNTFFTAIADDGDTLTKYGEIKNGKYYYYYQESSPLLPVFPTDKDAWKRAECEKDFYEQWLVYTNLNEMFFSGIRSRAWNGKDGYTCHIYLDYTAEGGDVLDADATFKIVDKKLASIEMETEGMRYSCLVYNYGESVVKFPSLGTGGSSGDEKPESVAGDVYRIKDARCEYDPSLSEEELKEYVQGFEKYQKEILGAAVAFRTDGTLYASSALEELNGITWVQYGTTIVIDPDGENIEWELKDGVVTVVLPDMNTIVYATTEWVSNDADLFGSGEGDIPSHNHYDKDGDGRCDECGVGIASGGDDVPEHKHYDKDGDGICDECGTVLKGETPAPDVPAHNHYDKDGDGICDECGTVLDAEPSTPSVEETKPET